MDNQQPLALRRSASLRRPGTPWQDDTFILERIAVGLKAWNSGYHGLAVLGIVNRWLEDQGIAPVDIQTIYADRKRALDYLRSELQASAEDNRLSHVASVQQIKAQTQALLDSTEPSQHTARSLYLNTLLRAEDMLAKLDGSYVQAERQALESGGQTITRVYRVIAEKRETLDITPSS